MISLKKTIDHKASISQTSIIWWKRGFGLWNKDTKLDINSYYQWGAQEITTVWRIITLNHWKLQFGGFPQDGCTPGSEDSCRMGILGFLRITHGMGVLRVLRIPAGWGYSRFWGFLGTGYSGFWGFPQDGGTPGSEDFHGMGVLRVLRIPVGWGYSGFGRFPRDGVLHRMGLLRVPLISCVPLKFPFSPVPLICRALFPYSPEINALALLCPLSIGRISNLKGSRK